MAQRTLLQSFVATPVHPRPAPASRRRGAPSGMALQAAYTRPVGPCSCCAAPAERDDALAQTIAESACEGDW